MKSRILKIILVIILLGLFAGTGFYFGTRVQAKRDKESTPVTTVDLTSFWKTWNLINEKYVNGNNSSTTATTTAKSVTDEEKVFGAISGLVASLNDPYTVFFPPKESKDFNDEIKGSFSGVGMEMGIKEGGLTVIAPLPDSPAEKAGIKAGDKIIKIEGKPAEAMSIDEAISLIRGEEGTAVNLTVFRSKESKTFDVKIVRAVINIPTIKTKTITDKKSGEKVFVIELYNFSANSATLFQGALREFVLSGGDKLILDLRGNPGGYLDSAVSMASWFLPKGKIVAKEVHNAKGEDKDYRSAGYDVFDEKLKMIVLVDQGSASAAEILAGALQEYKIAKLVGEKTFGKGSVQELVPITDESSLKITVAKWLTPNGHSISKEGLTPDYVVSFSADDIKNPKDPQLDKAVELLTTGSN